MKRKFFTSLFLMLFTLSIFSCREQTTGEKVEDAVEDVADDVEDAVE